MIDIKTTPATISMDMSVPIPVLGSSVSVTSSPSSRVEDGGTVTAVPITAIWVGVVDTVAARVALVTGVMVVTAEGGVGVLVSGSIGWVGDGLTSTVGTIVPAAVVLVAVFSTCTSVGVPDGIGRSVITKVGDAGTNEGVAVGSSV